MMRIRLISCFFTLLTQITNWFMEEAAQVYNEDRSSQSYGSGKALSVQKRLKKIYSSNMADPYITTIIAGSVIFSAGYIFSIYRLSLSPLCQYISSPTCYNLTGQDLAQLDPAVHALNYIDTSISPTASMLFFSLNTIMFMFGLYSGLLISNWGGRRFGMAISSLPNVIGWSLLICFAFTKDHTVFYVAHMLTAFSAGIVLLSTLVYLVEICGPKQIVYISGCVAIPFVAGFLCGWTVHLINAPPIIYLLHRNAAEYDRVRNSIIAYTDSYIHWLWLAFLGIVIAIFNIVAVRLLPESPQWLVHKGNEGYAEKSLQVLGSKYEDHTKKLEQIKDLELSDHVVENQKATCSLIKYCLNNHLRTSLSTLLLVLLQQVGGANLTFSYCESLFEYGFGNSENAAVSAAMICLGFLVSSMIFSKCVGYRTFLIVSAILASTACFLYTFFLGLFLNHFRINRYAIYILWLHIVSQSFSAAQLLPIIHFISMLPSARLRAKGTFAMLSLLTTIVYVMSWLKLVISCYVLFLIFTLANFVILLVIPLFYCK